ncbi:MAG TPA: molecular chaperone HtpG [Prolixibacteraceae bacterium]|nr:molecular chaperone HtpG [Prolixibacteraceae bacterium]HPS13266.1 molecular chaperone HtpG [Prolixibacteraceae bacterium]
MSKGKIGVTSENLFPIIKKFLYSDHEIFLREIISNAVDASQKLKTLAMKGEYIGDVSDLKVSVRIDNDAKTLIVSDNGIGMTADEVKKYINQIAFSGASEFLDKYKDDAASIIGHFGLGFYSSFMVSDKVEIDSLSFQEGAEAIRWSCDGSPEYTLTKGERTEVGTDIIMHITEESNEFIEEHRVKELLEKYCKFLPVPIKFGKEKEWKDGKYEDTDKDLIINDTNPAWTRKPADLTEEDYHAFYHKLYPGVDEPLFNIHLNVDYPFKLTGILYFPKLKNTVEVQKNKIQLYCNQVFVTDHVEEIVPDFLTLLHGVIDSPDIPLNVSRSYLQSDQNVKKISNHITKKVADRLEEIFKNDREKFEKNWDDLKIFIEYGILSNEKFDEKARKFFLYKNTDDKYFTTEEYENIIGNNQKDKEDNLIHLYTNNKESQYSFISAAKDKGYDVLLLDSVLTAPLINKFEQANPKNRFTRVDSDVIDKLIDKGNEDKIQLSQKEQDELEPLFSAVTPKGEAGYYVTFEDLGENAQPMVITQNEFMRRMKDMSAIQSGMSFYGNLPDNYTVVVNVAHPLVKQVIENKNKALENDLSAFETQLKEKQDEKNALEKLKIGKKEEEIPQEEKDKMQEVSKEITRIENEKRDKLSEYGKEDKLSKQLLDLALLANNMLKGEALDQFVKRSVELIK